MIRSKIAMGSFLTALALLLHFFLGIVGPVHGQGTRKDDIVFNSRAQTNITNTFTAPQVFDGDLHAKGPNPYYDLARFGLYTGGSGGITCSTRAGSSTLACPGGVADFAVGHGIEMPLAGVAPTFNAWGTTAIAGYSRSRNVAQYLYSNTTFGAGQTVTISGLADSSFNGTFTVLGNDGDQGHFTVTNVGANVGFAAGSGTAKLTSPALVVTPSGILHGSTRYDYKVVLRGYNGELSVASPAGTTTAGAATLGVNSASISSITRSGGLTTVTTSATHNFQSGVQVNVSGTGDNSFNGAFTIVTTPTSTTFTYWQNGAGDSADTVSSGLASVVAKNTVQWNMQQYTVLQSIIYRRKNNGAYSIVGITQGMDSAFVDWGLGAPATPGYIPRTPPISTTNGILATTITAINGTNLTLATAATASVTNQTARHDNAPVVLAGCAAMGTGVSGTLLIPVTNPTANIVFNSPLDFYHRCVSDQITLAVGSAMNINDPFILRKGMTIKALPGGSASQTPQLATGFTNWINGVGYPFIYFVPGNFGPTTIENFAMACNGIYQSCVLQDQDAGGGGVAGILYNNDYFTGGPGAMPFLMRSGGFDFWFERGGFYANGGGWGVPEALTISVNHGLGITNQNIAAIMHFNKTIWSGEGILYESYGMPLAATPGNTTFQQPLFESGVVPWLRFNTANGTTASGITINNLAYADIVGGWATPVIDVTNINYLSTFQVNDPGCANGVQPLFEGNAQGGTEIFNGYGGCGIIGLLTYINHNLGAGQASEIFNNASLTVNGSGQIIYPMALPAAPSLAASAGGSVPVGAHNYAIAALDANLNTTTLGPGVSINVTSGNQTVTVTPPALPPGAIGYRAYRDGTEVQFSSCSTQYSAAGTPYVDTFGFTCGGTPPTSNSAALTALNQAGIIAPQLKLVGGGAVNTIAGAFSASRTQILPDVSGIVPVTSYLNSAYDNFNRGNGAIGGNWTVSSGGFNVTGNAVVGTGASNLALWAGNTFSSTGQFAQVTVATLNGVTDFVGVDVLLSAGNNGYTCVENNAQLLLQKLTAGTGATLTSSATAGAAGDVLRLEVNSAGNLTCSRVGANSVTLTATDTTFTSGSPAIEQFGRVATMKNWSGGNLHPIGQLDIEQGWTKTQHFVQGVALGGEVLSASPRGEQNVFLPGALTATWTGSTWTPDKAVTITRVQVQAKTAPAGCATNAVVRLTDGSTPVNVTLSGAANDSGAISQNYAAGAALQVLVQTAAAGCGTSPADANVVLQYRMQ